MVWKTGKNVLSASHIECTLRQWWPKGQISVEYLGRASKKEKATAYAIVPTGNLGL
jgi:hypothetical protein